MERISPAYKKRVQTVLRRTGLRLGLLLHFGEAVLKSGESGKRKFIKLGVGKRGRGDMRHLLIQGAHAVMRKGRDTTLGKWGRKLFARKGDRNTAVVAIARKHLVQVWHLLSGNPPTTLEADKGLTSRLRIAAC